MKRYLFIWLHLGAVLCGTATAVAAAPAPLELSLADAIGRGLRANTAVAVAASRVAEANGSLDRRQALYLPHLRIETPVAYQTRNLKAQGISFSNTPTVVGPFSSFDFRIYGEQALLDLQSYHAIKAGERERDARTNDFEDVRSKTIRLVADSYLGAEYAAARVITAESRVKTATVLEQLARDQREAGIADGLDVLRAQVELANERQKLLVARNEAAQSLLVLARSIGVELGTPLLLTDRLTFAGLTPPTVAAAIDAALESRPDYRSLRAQRESLTEQLKSAQARYLPKIVVSGNYGTSGQKLDRLEPSGMIQANLVLTLFDADRGGERVELESRLRRVEQLLADQRRGVEQDVREALLDLQSAEEQVLVAGSGLELAEKELQFASDRFRNGVTNNVEVVKAQDSLARAHDNNLAALVQHAAAKIALARALGNSERDFRQFLGIAPVASPMRGSEP